MTKGPIVRSPCIADESGDFLTCGWSPSHPAPGNGGLAREKVEWPRQEITMALGINTALV